MTTARTKQGRTVRMTTANSAFGAVSGHRLVECGIPSQLCKTAAATCEISLMGWRRGMHDGDAPRNRERHFLSGRWGHIKLATCGELPKQPQQWRGSTGNTARFVYADNFAAINTVLSCFGLNIERVIQWATNGNGLQEDDRVTLSLREIVTALCPVMTATDALLGDTNPHIHATARQTAMALV